MYFRKKNRFYIKIASNSNILFYCNSQNLFRHALILNCQICDQTEYKSSYNAVVHNKKIYIDWYVNRNLFIQGSIFTYSKFIYFGSTSYMSYPSSKKPWVVFWGQQILDGTFLYHLGYLSHIIIFSVLQYFNNSFYFHV